MQILHNDEIMMVLTVSSFLCWCGERVMNNCVVVARKESPGYWQIANTDLNSWHRPWQLLVSILRIRKYKVTPDQLIVRMFDQSLILFLLTLVYFSYFTDCECKSVLVVSWWFFVCIAPVIIISAWVQESGISAVLGSDQTPVVWQIRKY